MAFDGQPRLKWFSVRCLFRHGEEVFEERITLWHARDFEHAIELAEADAADYAAPIDTSSPPAEYLHLAQAYELADDPGRSDAEVFSLMRDSPLSPDAYLDHFFETGHEHQN